MDYKVFIEKATKVHGNRYEYEEFDNIPVTKKIKIKCKEHGYFEQVMYAHLKGEGCPRCTGKRRGFNTESFIKAAKEKFGDKFDYSLVEYKTKRDKVCIKCDELKTELNPDGIFWQKPLVHLDSKNGLPRNKYKERVYGKITDEDVIREKTAKFLTDAKSMWKDKLLFDKVIYTGCQQKITVTCPIHGDFIAQPDTILKGHGCPRCARVVPMPLEEFIAKATEKHQNKYDYKNVEIGKTFEKVEIICPIHGPFFQTPLDHLRGRGCPKCAKNQKRDTKEFVKKAKEVHGDRYDYSKVEYVNHQTKVCIICKEHGEFWQTPASHLSGQGCPNCKKSYMEEEIGVLLKENNISYDTEHTFPNIKHKTVLPFDFFLPDYKVLIECQGIQHFVDSHFFKDDDRKVKDEIKYKGAIENGYRILYYTNVDDFQSYFGGIYNDKNLFNNKDILLEEIKNGLS